MLVYSFVTCLFVSLLVCLFVYLFVYLFICFFTCLSLCLLVCLPVYLFVSLFTCLFTCLLVCLFVYQFVYLFTSLLVRMVDLSSLQHKDTLTRQSNLGEFLSGLHKNTIPITDLSSEDKYDLVSVLIENVKNSNPRLILPSLECLQTLSETCITTELNLLNKTIIGILYAYFHTFMLKTKLIQ